MKHIAIIAVALAACGNATDLQEEEPDIAGETGGAPVVANDAGRDAGGAGKKTGSGGSRPDAAPEGGNAVVPEAGAGGAFKIGLIADTHWGQTTWGQKSPGFVTDATAKMEPWKPDVIAVLGDIVDGTWDKTAFAGYLGDFSARAKVPGADRAVIVGNHDTSAMGLETVLANWPADVSARFVSGTMYSSFDRNGVHVVSIDAEYKDGVEPEDHKSVSGTSAPGYVPLSELAWLEADLAATKLPTVVLSHQLMGGGAAGELVTDAAAVQAVLETSRKVVACFAGHAHMNLYAAANGIAYFTVNSISAQAWDDGYTAHDKGMHAQATIDPSARTIKVETYENDSAKGYVLAHTETATYASP